MAKRQLNLLLWAALLVAAGVVLLLFNLGVLARFEPWVQLGAATALAVGGAGMLLSYFWVREAWWRLMPGWTLLALAGMVWLSTREGVARPWSGALLFVGLALAFVHIYLVNRQEHWWAIIPGGFMGVLALVIALSIRVTRLETLGSVLFTGMGLVFGALFGLAGRRRHWWALIPGTVLVLFGLLVYAVDNSATQGALLRWWPAALVILGALVALGATLLPAAPAKLPVSTAPGMFGRSPARAEDLRARSQLGEYSQPAPGASVEVLPDPDDRR